MPHQRRRPTRSHLTGLPRTVVALGVVSFFTDLSSEMIYPLLPAFLVTVLGAGAVALGTIEGIAESTAAVLKVFSGRWADRMSRRKPLVVGGYGLSGFMRPLIGLVVSWPSVVFLRFADRIGKGLRSSPRDALIADVTPPERLGAAYGLHRAMDHGGAVAGPLVAAGLLLIPGIGLREVFLLAGIPAILVMLVLFFAVNEPADRPVASGPPPSIIDGWQATEPPFRRLLLAVIVFTLGNSTDAFLLLRLTDVGFAPAWVALLWSLHHVVKLLANLFGGQLSDRVSRRALIGTGWLLYAAIYLGFGLTTNTAGLVALFLIYGIYFGLTEPVERAWVAALAPAESRGGAFGFFHGSVGLTALPASLLFGALYTTLGPAAAFGTGAALAVAATVLLIRVPAPSLPSTVS
ncbi:MAG: MFS transporter [Acidimicrobiia bacterium]|nr:MFS transporter [Acidimicrobiia bacterium]MDH5504774.1 MFS transporter [Acidimicrobiia bacterium]